MCVYSEHYGMHKFACFTLKCIVSRKVLPPEAIKYP